MILRLSEKATSSCMIFIGVFNVYASLWTTMYDHKDNMHYHHRCWLFFSPYSLSSGGILILIFLLLLLTWPDTLPGWLGVCLHLLQVLKTVMICLDQDALIWRSLQPWRCWEGATQGTQWGRAQRGGRPPRRRLQRCTAALQRWKIPAQEDKVKSRVLRWRGDWPGQGGRLQSRELISRPPSQSWSRRQASSSCSQGEVKIWTRLSIWFVREKFNLMAVG